MTRMTASEINSVNNSREIFRVTGLGTRLDTLEFGSAPTPLAGTIVNAPVIKYSVAPTVGSATATKAAFALTSSAQTGITAGITQPDVCRNLTIKGNASGITGNVILYGTNYAGASINETVALNGSTEVAGAKCFATVTSIDYPAEVHAGTDTVSIGRGVIIGLPFAVANAAQVIAKNFDGAVDAGTATGATTVEGSKYSVAGTMNGTKIVDLYILK